MMERKIRWAGWAFDEIDLIYEKAEGKENAENLLAALEEAALAEAKQNCSLLTTDVGNTISPEQFDELSDLDKETVIKVLSDQGLADLSQDMSAAVIRMRFAPCIQSVMACTVFNILNRLEKLDGALNVLIPKWTLQLEVPLNGKKGLFQWELLIMQLNPWLSVKETSYNMIAEPLTRKIPNGAEPKSPPAPDRPAAEPKKEPDPAPPAKKSFLKRLFKK